MKLLFLVVIPLAGLLAFIAWSERQEWEEFKSRHACQRVSEEADRVGYRCNDGLIYWRKRNERNT